MLQGEGRTPSHLRLECHALESSDNNQVWDHSYGSTGSDSSEVFDSRQVDTKDVNRKLMRLSVDARAFGKRPKLAYDTSEPVASLGDDSDILCSPLDVFQEFRMFGKMSRFPRIEEMAHFHYHHVDFCGALYVTLEEGILELNEGNVNTHLLTINVACGLSTWTVKRTFQEIMDLDQQVHVCLYDRRYSCLAALQSDRLLDLQPNDRWRCLESYFHRFSMIAGENINCGPVLNWLELDNHGNHLVVMEADDSAINVPALAAALADKRYVAQAKDELSLEVGDLVSVIDMPPSEETVWWRGKKGLEVGFFPSHCVELLGTDLQDGPWQFRNRPVINRRGKLVSLLRFFFKARPTKDELMQSGILRDRMFGCDLGEHLTGTKTTVPLVLTMCSNVIEQHGIVDGIYRLSGITSNMQKLRVAFDNDETPNLSDARYLNDIHCISSLLKTYFRELPNPLLTYELYDKFVAAMSKEKDTERTVSFHHVIQRLPPPHYRTLEYLLRHLSKVARCASDTNMNEKNLAIVWAPNLLRPNLDEFGTTALAAIRTQAIIVEYLIKNVDIFFDTNLASSTIAFYPEENTDDVVSPREDCATGVAVSVANGRDHCAHPKLISLHEARQRALRKEDIQVVPGSASDMLNVPRHNDTTNGSKVPEYHDRFVAVPTQPATKPVSPGPDLVSLEEARARTRTRSIVLSSRKGSVDLAEIRNKSATTGGRFAPPPNKRRTWKSLFSRRGVDDEATGEVMGVNDDENATGSMYRRSDNHDIFSASHPSQSSAGGSGVWRRRKEDQASDNPAPVGVTLHHLVPLHRTYSSPAGTPNIQTRSPFTRQEVFRTSGRDAKRAPKVDCASSDAGSVSSSSSSSCVTPPPLRRIHDRIQSPDRPSSTPGQSRRFDRLVELLKRDSKTHDSSDDELPSPTPVDGGEPFVVAATAMCDDGENDNAGQSDGAGQIMDATAEEEESPSSDATMNGRHKPTARDALLSRGQREMEEPSWHQRVATADDERERAAAFTSDATSAPVAAPRQAPTTSALDWLPVMQKSLADGDAATEHDMAVGSIKHRPEPFPVVTTDLCVLETAILDDDCCSNSDSGNDLRPASFYDNRRPSMYDNIE